MRKRFLELSQLSLLLAGLLCAQAAMPQEHADHPNLQRGRMSNAMLARVYRLCNPDLEKCCPGATEALTFVFFVEPVADAVEPTITETRDFSIDGKSYRTLSLERLGKAIEPTTVIYTAADVLKANPELQPLLPEGFKPTSAFMITIGGTFLPSIATGEIVLKTGFHRDTESFAFHFSIPPKPGA